MNRARIKLTCRISSVVALSGIASWLILSPAGNRGDDQVVALGSASPSRASEGDGTSMPQSRFRGFSSGFQTLLDVHGYSYLSVGVGEGQAGFGLEWIQNLSFDPGNPIWGWLGTVGGGGLAPGRYRQTAMWRTSFHPEQVIARDSETIVLAGHPSFGGVLDVSKYVIEIWALQYPPGSPHLRRPTSHAPIGVSTAYALPELGVDSPPFATCSTLEAPVEHRQLMYSGSSLADTTAIAVDPDGRFILCGTSTGELYQIPLEVGGEADPVLLFSAGQIAALSTASEISPRQHQTHGRIYIIPRGPIGPVGTPDAAGDLGDHSRSVLVDADNDGVFESVVEIADMAWQSSDYADESLWVDGFDRNMW